MANFNTDVCSQPTTCVNTDTFLVDTPITTTFYYPQSTVMSVLFGAAQTTSLVAYCYDHGVIASSYSSNP
jgi:hypothetical protein